MKAKHVAYLVSKFPALSETFISREVLLLKRLGLEVRVFSFCPPSAEEAERLDPNVRALVKEVCYISIGETSVALMRHWPSALRLWKENSQLQRACTLKPNKHLRLARAIRLAEKIKMWGAEHLHAHWPYASQVAYLVHKLIGIPYSISVHAHEVEHDNGHFPVIFESLSFAAFCNHAGMDHLLERLPPSSREKCYLIYHGVDLDHFKPCPLPRPLRPLRVVSAGRLTRTKGFHRLILACSRLRSVGMEVELIILGQGSMADELRQLADRVGFSSYLQIPGWVPHNLVREYLVNSHVFALPADTNYHDGLPNVVLEAMAVGRPVILSPLPAAREAIEDGIEGFILGHADDVEGLACALKRLADKPRRLEEMGIAARRKVESKFNMWQQIRHLAKLLEGVSQGGRPW